MLRLSLEHVKAGMVISRNIYNTNGSLLLGKEMMLDDNLIRRLFNMKIDAVYVKNPYCEVEQAQEILHEKTRLEAVRVTQRTFEQFRKNQNLNLAGFQLVLKKIIEDIMDNKNVLIHLTDIRTHDDYTFGHSINVCLIATMIGVKLRLTETQLGELAMGAILHDIGKMTIEPRLLGKKDLTEEEWQVIKAHAQTGFDLLRKQGAAVPLVSAHVAYQHHESYDGTGYPRGIEGDSIHRYARIVAIADVYDAATSERPYRPAMLPHEAYEVILGSRGTKLDPTIADIFLENVALFPVGTMVQLDTGETGVVEAVLPKLQARPIIKVILDASGQKLPEPKILDLTKELTRFITKVFKPEEIFNIRPRA